MAGEVIKVANVRVQSEGPDDRQFQEQSTVPQTGDGVDDRTHHIGSAAHQALVFPAITTKGAIAYENLSAVVIHLGIDVAGVFYPFCSTPPGDVGSFHGSTQNYYAKADSGTDNPLRLFVAES